MPPNLMCWFHESSSVRVLFPSARRVSEHTNTHRHTHTHSREHYDGPDNELPLGHAHAYAHAIVRTSPDHIWEFIKWSHDRMAIAGRRHIDASGVHRRAASVRIGMAAWWWWCWHLDLWRAWAWMRTRFVCDVATRWRFILARHSLARGDSVGIQSFRLRLLLFWWNVRAKKWQTQFHSRWRDATSQWARRAWLDCEHSPAV